MSAGIELAGVLGEEALAAPPDEVRWLGLGAAPEAVVSPRDADEVAAVLRWASAEGVGVVPAGSGRRLGPRTVRGRCVVVTTDRLRGVEVYEPADVTFTARAGTQLRDIDAALRPNGQWLPLDPPFALDRTLGGLVASGASGPLATGYGSLRNHVLGMTVVTGDGRVLRLGGRVVKNVAGFDLLKPMIGSRGRLAFVTSVCMRAFPEPAVDRLLTLRSSDAVELLAVASAIGTAPVLPVSIVLSRDTRRSREALLSVRLHGAAQTVEADRATLERHVGTTFEPAAGGAGAAAPEETGAAEPVVLDVSVLPGRLPEAVALVERLSPAVLHADTYVGRLRVGLPALDHEAVRAARDGVERLGGALGVERAPPGVEVDAVSTTRSAAERALGAAVAGVFDPQGVMWRGDR